MTDVCVVFFEDLKAKYCHGTAGTPSSREEVLGNDIGDQQSIADRMIELVAQRQAESFASSVLIFHANRAAHTISVVTKLSQYDVFEHILEFHTPLRVDRV